MADSVAKRAVRETREMTRLAVDAAKNEIVEELAPAIRDLLERRLREGLLGEDVERLSGEGVNRMRQAHDGYSGISDFEEGTDQMKKKDRKTESITDVFPSISEAYGEEMDESRPTRVGADEEMDESGIPTLGEGEDEMDEAKGGEEDMDEDLEISESELEEMYKEALQLEVDVKKGFHDMEKPKDMGGIDPLKAHALTDPSSVADIKSGEHFFQTEKPPHKEDWIPEDVRRLISQGISENKKLTNENKKLSEMVRKLHGKLTEMNIFNSKILHANRFMTRHSLNMEQKRSVVESLDRAASLQEVKRIYAVLESSFKAAGAVTESVRKPHADSQKARRSAAPTEKVLRESVDSTQSVGHARWQELAGLTNGKR